MSSVLHKYLMTLLYDNKTNGNTSITDYSSMYKPVNHISPDIKRRPVIIFMSNLPYYRKYREYRIKHIVKHLGNVKSISNKQIFVFFIRVIQ